MVVFIKGKPRVDPSLKDDQVIWRYLDAARFFDFVHSQTLFFTRGDKFEDKFEGAFTDSLKQAIQHAYEVNKISSSYEEFKKGLRERVFVNCWHASADDSMAMWRMYGGSSEAVAITSTIGQLKATFEQLTLPYYLSIVKVTYVKHWRNPELKINPYSNVFAYKVKAYEFEKEVRVIIDRSREELASDNVEVGMPIHVPLGKFLRSTVVGPEARPWFFELVRGVTEKYNVSTPVRRSKLAGDAP